MRYHEAIEMARLVLIFASLLTGAGCTTGELALLS